MSAGRPLAIRANGNNFVISGSKPSSVATIGMFGTPRDSDRPWGTERPVGHGHDV